MPSDSYTKVLDATLAKASRKAVLRRHTVTKSYPVSVNTNMRERREEA